jgi:hypothetical protein
MKIRILLFLAFSSMSVVRSSAQQQAYMLRSTNPELAKNKKLVYDFWRIVFEGGHLDEAANYMTESYIQQEVVGNK